MIQSGGVEGMIVEAEEIYIFKERATGVVCVCMCVCVSICLSVGNARVGGGMYYGALV